MERINLALSDSSFTAKLALIEKAEDFSRSFSSAMLAKKRNDGLRIAFSFGAAGMSFILDEYTGLTGYEIPKQLHGTDTGSAAFKLASFLGEKRPLQDRNIGNGPSIKNVTLSYDDTQLLKVTFTATSDIGLREAVFNSNEYNESIYFKGSRREGITKTLQIDSSHSVLAIRVYDTRGNSATAYYPIFEDKREAGRLDLAKRKRLSEERVWAQKNPVNQALYTLGQFDGNIGWWCRAIADALISQDIAKDSLRDARVKEAVKPDTAEVKKLNTQKTIEVIGE
jgi:hypothetical protein